MGVLTSSETGRSYTLGARAVVGRSEVCAIALTDPLSSGEHAVLYWQDDGWWVRDLGSRNGTWVEDHRLGPGEPRPLRTGATVSSGPAAAPGRLGEGGPPAAPAERVGDGAWRTGLHGTLALPDDEDPEVVVYADADGRWVAETADRVVGVRDGQVLVVEGQAWRLGLPSGLAGTQEPGAPPAAEPALRFRVSRDEEHVALTVEMPDRAVDMPDRVFNYALLTLARARAEDAGLPASEQGWRYVDDVCAALRLERRTFNVYVHRARRAFGEAGIEESATLVERRQQADQLRLGIARIDIRHA